MRRTLILAVTLGLIGAALGAPARATTPAAGFDGVRAWNGLAFDAVRASRAGDGSAPVRSQPAGTGPGVFRAAWAGVQYASGGASATRCWPPGCCAGTARATSAPAPAESRVG